MPRVLQTVGPRSAVLVDIGFFPRALRNHSRRFTVSKHSGVTPCRYSALKSAGLAFHRRSRHSGVSRSNEAPAKSVRVIRLVRFGAAPEYTYRSGREITGWPSALLMPLTWWQRLHW